jgi:plasmid stabilization system protein ParE
MAEIRWTSEAETWLKDIYDYIAQDNPAAASRVIEGIYQKAQMLSNFPDIDYIYRSDSEGEIRILLYGHYRIAYLRSDNENVISILGVFHGALDINRYFPQKKRITSHSLRHDQKSDILLCLF